MIDAEHQRAQALAVEAAEALKAGDHGRARELFSVAADVESQVLERVPAEKVRTASILAVSLASLQFKAGRFDAAESICRDLLINRDLLPSARAQLLDILAAIPRPAHAGG